MFDMYTPYYLENYRSFSRDFKKNVLQEKYLDHLGMKGVVAKHNEEQLRKLIKDYSKISTYDILYHFLKPDYVKEYINKIKYHFGTFRAEKEIRRHFFPAWVFSNNKDKFKEYKVPIMRKDGFIQHYWRKKRDEKYNKQFAYSEVQRKAYKELWID